MSEHRPSHVPKLRRPRSARHGLAPMQKAVQAPEAAAAGEVAGDDGNGEQRRPPPVQSLSSLPASGGGKSGPPSAGRSKSIDGSGAPGSGGASKEKLRNRLMRMSTEAMADGSWNETPGGESSGQAGPVELDCEMLRMILMDAGNPFSEEEMAAFFELADPDDAGKVSLEALRRLPCWKTEEEEEEERKAQARQLALSASATKTSGDGNEPLPPGSDLVVYATVPDGVSSGDVLAVETSRGTFKAVVPDGVRAGDTFGIQVTGGGTPGGSPLQTSSPAPQSLGGISEDEPLAPSGGVRSSISRMGRSVYQAAIGAAAPASTSPPLSSAPPPASPPPLGSPPPAAAPAASPSRPQGPAPGDGAARLRSPRTSRDFGEAGLSPSTRARAAPSQRMPGSTGYRAAAAAAPLGPWRRSWRPRRRRAPAEAEAAKREGEGRRSRSPTCASLRSRAQPLVGWRRPVQQTLEAVAARRANKGGMMGEDREGERGKMTSKPHQAARP